MDMSRYVSPQRARSTDERPLHQWTLALAMRDRALILPALLLAAFAINLDTTIVNVALPSLVRELHASNTQLQWIVDAYNLVFAALLLASGSLSDRVGRKGMLLAGLGVFGGADRRPLRDGTGRGDDLPGHPLADLQRLHRARRACEGDRIVGRHRWRGGRPRADRRRLAAIESWSPVA
jgi:MFS transporter